MLGVERLYIVDPEFPVQQQTVPMGSWLSSLRTTEDVEPSWSSLKNLPVTPYLGQQEKIQLCDHSQGHRGFLWVPPPHLYAPTKPSFWTPRFSQLRWAKRPLFTWPHEVGARQLPKSKCGILSVRGVAEGRLPKLLFSPLGVRLPLAYSANLREGPAVCQAQYWVHSCT